jgi:hypothetical protein
MRSLQLHRPISIYFQPEDRSQVQEISLGCSNGGADHTYKIFVKTFLGFGANEALSRHRRDLILAQIKDNAINLTGLSPASPVFDPCLPRDFSQTVGVDIGTAMFDVPIAYRKQERQIS